MKRKATKAELAHLAAVKRLPCLACVKYGHHTIQCGVTEGHHTLSGGRRRGHMFVIPLGRWHHQGIPLAGWKVEVMNKMFGPSLRLASKRFHAEFGNDESLLAETEQLLAKQSVEAA
jgi:hypothetical protein